MDIVTILLLGALGIAGWLFGQRRQLQRQLMQAVANKTDLEWEHKQLNDQLSQLRQEHKEAVDTIAVKLADSVNKETEYRRLLDNLPFPLWRRDSSLALIWCNTVYARVAEASPERVIEAKIELASSIDPEQPIRLAEQALKTAQMQTERRHIVVSGDRKAFRFTEFPQADGLLGFAEDVSELERIETDLSQHISAHTEVLQNINTAIAIYGPSRRLVLFNHAFAKLWRMDENWLADQPSYDEILEHLRAYRRLPEQANWQVWKKTQLDLFTSIIEPREELLHLPDDRTLRVVVTPHPFGGLLFNYEDVSDRLGLERARNTLIAVQRATLDNLHEGVAVYGADGRLKLWNPALEKISRLTPDFLNAAPHISDVIEAIRPQIDDGRNWRAVYDRIIEAFGERYAFSGRSELYDGRVFDFASVPLPDGAMLYSYLDITDSVRIERALRDRNEALQAADQLKSEFIANVSYELRTPLNTIIGFTEILTNEYFGGLNERQKEYTQGVLDSSNHLLMLVNDILDLATIEAGHLQLETEQVDLHQILVGVLSLTREHCLRRNLTVHFEATSDLGIIEADERRIKQVIYNLLNNALKFTPPNGSITLGAIRINEEVKLWVSDTGVGIPENEQAQVFDKFVKGSNAQRHLGAGLGLPLVRRFVEMHGGRIELQSTPSVGTTITCWLPVTQQEVLAPTH